MSDILIKKFLDYDGLTTYTNKVKEYVNSKSPYIYDFDAAPNALADEFSMPRTSYNEFIAAYNSGIPCSFVKSGDQGIVTKVTDKTNTYICMHSISYTSLINGGATIYYHVFEFIDEGGDNIILHINEDSTLVIPTKTSQLVNDSGFITVEDPEGGIGGDLDGELMYLVKGPQTLTAEEQTQVKENLNIVIPEKLSDLENDVVTPIASEDINELFNSTFYS